MLNFRKQVAGFSYEYKIGLFGKKSIALLTIYDEYIEGIAAIYYEGKFYEQRFNIPFENIYSMDQKTVGDQVSLVIEYRSADKIVNRKDSAIIFPQMEDIENVIKALQEQKDRFIDARKLDYEMRKKQEEDDLQKMEECRQFYKKCYDFHITDQDRPYYELYQNELQLFCIYIDQDKNINFLFIDGCHHDENNACIPYNKIHYYEKAGNVHYTTEINGSYSSFGGSFSGATFSKKRTIICGLLFGPMGMALGAVSSYKPAKFEMPATNISLSSVTHRIDERSVILNYYSDTREQYIDIELPADMYNFLQTHLPQKKYGIVLELERHQAVRQNEKSGIDFLEPPRQRVDEFPTDKNMELFESKVKKLKIMYDNKIISDKEFEAERSKLLKELRG